jgi:DNA-binding IclR family transcriptional regulator
MNTRTQVGADEPEHQERFSRWENDRKFVVALARGLEVLRAFRVRDGFLGNNEIAERTGLPRPTVTRLTYTLCELGYLMQVPRLNKYQLAPSAITLGYSALANLGIRQVARPLMQKVAEELAAPVALGVLDRNRALYVDIARGSSAFTVQLDVGARIPLAKTAMGWALIAVMGEAQREETYASLAERHPDEWPVLRRRIEAAIADYPEKGFVSSPGTWRSDIHAVGVALRTADDSGIYAFNCGGPPHQFTLEKMDTVFGPAIVRLVRDIELVLNGN